MVAVSPVGICSSIYKLEDSTSQMALGLHAQKREAVWLQIWETQGVTWQTHKYKREPVWLPIQQAGAMALHRAYFG